MTVTDKRLIKADKSVIVAADLSYRRNSAISKFEKMVDNTINVAGISGYKLGPISSMMEGLKGISSYIRGKAYQVRESGRNVVIIYDHQKAGNDIPDIGSAFMTQLYECGVNAVILFPFAGPVTQTEWTKAAFDCGLVPIVGGEMTHPKFLEKDGGYIDNEAPERIYCHAVDAGVRDFVVPGNKPDRVKYYRELIASELGDEEFTLYAPGFISQGGDITETGQVAGPRFHAIVGSAIYKSEDMHAAALQVTSQL